MGFAYVDLIPAAILLDNPGITREEFSELLDKTHYSWIKRYEREDPWDSYNFNEPDIKDYHSGLNGLAKVLGLTESKEFIKFQKPRVDENGLFVKAPDLWPARKEDEHAYEVVIHEKNVFEPTKVIEALSWTKLQVEDIWKEVQLSIEKGIVTRIFEEIKPFYSKFREEKFQTKEKLYEKWPQFHSDFKYDWSQKRGSLKALLAENCFFWRQQDKRYYLHDKTFDIISPSFRISRDFGYTDLILTAEAIKNKAWKLLSYRGDIHIPQFLKNFPDSRKRHGKAVWDAYTSLYAKSKQMPVRDFLKMRTFKARD